MKKTVAISGSTGFIAGYLIPELKSKGYNIVPLLREDFKNQKKLEEKLTNVNGVVNLAGAPIIKRWTKSYRRELLNSRVDLTKTIVETVKKIGLHLDFFVSASAVGLYRDGMLCSEECKSIRDDFLGRLCVEWEKAASGLKDKTRVVVLRIGVVIGKGGGIIKKVSLPFKLGLGGRIGSGKQGFSWIHIEDLCRIIIFAMENSDIKGVINAVSPSPVDNMEFTRVLAGLLSRPALLPVPSFILSLLFGEGSAILLEGQRAVPERLLQSGFEFYYPDLVSALKQVFKR